MCGHHVRKPLPAAEGQPFALGARERRDLVAVGHHSVVDLDTVDGIGQAVRTPDVDRLDIEMRLGHKHGVVLPLFELITGFLGCLDDTDLFALFQKLGVNHDTIHQVVQSLLLCHLSFLPLFFRLHPCARAK